jgi:hypothetical protein
MPTQSSSLFSAIRTIRAACSRVPRSGLAPTASVRKSNWKCTKTSRSVLLWSGQQRGLGFENPGREAEPEALLALLPSTDRSMKRARPFASLG